MVPLIANLAVTIIVAIVGTHQRPITMIEEDSSTNASEWERLEDHFRQHASIVTYFSNASAEAVVNMLKTGVNDAGVCLSQFERDALIERHCELFGRWPE